MERLDWEASAAAPQRFQSTGMPLLPAGRNDQVPMVQPFSAVDVAQMGVEMALDGISAPPAPAPAAPAVKVAPLTAAGGSMPPLNWPATVPVPPVDWPATVPPTSAPNALINGNAPAPGTPAAVDRSTQMVRKSLNARLGASTAPAYTGSVMGQTLTPATMAAAPAAAPAAAAAGPLVPAPKPAAAAPAAASKYGLLGAEIPSLNPVAYLNSHAARAEAAAAVGTGAEAAQAARAAGRLRFAGNALKWGGRLGTVGAIGLGPVMSAVSGTQEAGIGAGAIQGGAALTGALIGGAISGPFAPLGAMAGGFVGDMVGKGASGLAVSAVDKAQEGDTGPMGAIGRALDPFIDTAYEKEQAAVLKQMNSPAMQQIRQQEEAREAKARADRQQDLLLQLTAQGAFA